MHEETTVTTESNWRRGESSDFHIGPFTVGDLIALGGVVFMSGALWWRVAALEREDLRQFAETERLTSRVQSLEQVIPSNYVRREEYREDVRELKSIMQRIELKVDGKVDRQ